VVADGQVGAFIVLPVKQIDLELQSCDAIAEFRLLLAEGSRSIWP
jgi:hypothetical protein